MFVELALTEHDVSQSCLRFCLKVAQKGQNFSTHGSGATVANASCLQDPNVPGHHLFWRKNLMHFGEPNSIKILLALWRQEELHSLSSLVCTKDHLAGVSAIKNSIIIDVSKHHGSCGKYYGFGCGASYTTLELTSPNLNSFDHYSLKKKPSKRDQQRINRIATALVPGAYMVSNKSRSRLLTFSTTSKHWFSGLRKKLIF